MSANKLKEIEWGECLLEPSRSKVLDRDVRRAFGVFLPVARFFYPSPWITQGFLYRNFRRSQLVHIDPDLAELIYLVVSRESSCRYCYAATRSLLRTLGMADKHIHRLENIAVAAEVDTKDHLALDFARCVAHSNPPPGATAKNALREAGYTDPELLEIAYVSAYAVCASLCTTIPALPLRLAEPSFQRWQWLLRPLVARLLRAGQRRAEPEFLSCEMRQGPFAYIISELDGLPAARILRELINGAWNSPLLSDRVKSLVFATIARELGSERMEREAQSLASHDSLKKQEIEWTLSHVKKSAFDAVEAAAVPFARETIRPRPVTIQRKARKLRDELGGERFLELVGLVGLGNLFGRLSLVLCEAEPR